MKPDVKRIVVLVAVFFAAVYAGDSLSVWRRQAAKNPNDPFDAVTHPNLLAIPQKGNRVEYALDAQSPMVSTPCVHALFPHSGYLPCWYVARKANTPTPMFLLPAANSHFWKISQIAEGEKR